MLKQTFSQVILGIDLPIVQPTAYSGKALQSLRRVKLKNFFIAKEITAGESQYIERITQLTPPAAQHRLASFCCRYVPG